MIVKTLQLGGNGTAEITQPDHSENASTPIGHSAQLLVTHDYALGKS
jgi:hypothetical protein